MNIAQIIQSKLNLQIKTSTKQSLGDVSVFE